MAISKVQKTGHSHGGVKTEDPSLDDPTNPLSPNYNPSLDPTLAAKASALPPVAKRDPTQRFTSQFTDRPLDYASVIGKS